MTETTSPIEQTAPPGRRFLSWVWDYLVILAWLVILVIVIGIPQMLGWLDLGAVWSNQVAADVAITILTVIPLWWYLVVTEAGASHASWGKRRAGLTVRGLAQEAPSRGQVVIRNLIKVLPWQFGHLAASRFAHAETSPFAIASYVISMVLLAAVALPPLFRRRGIHDVVGRTTVMPADGFFGSQPSP